MRSITCRRISILHVLSTEYPSCSCARDRDACQDDQFFDGFHGGELVYARILLALQAQDRMIAGLVDSDLRGMVEPARRPLQVVDDNFRCESAAGSD